jgi:hypothetical protein
MGIDLKGEISEICNSFLLNRLLKNSDSETATSFRIRFLVGPSLYIIKRWATQESVKPNSQSQD